MEESKQKQRVELPIDVVNDTDKWVVQLNSYFGYVDSEDEANKVLQNVFDKTSYIEDAGFYLAGKIPPNQKAKLGEKSVSLYRPIDLDSLLASRNRKRLRRDWDDILEKRKPNEAKNRLTHLKEEYQKGLESPFYAALAGVKPLPSWRKDVLN